MNIKSFAFSNPHLTLSLEGVDPLAFASKIGQRLTGFNVDDPRFPDTGFPGGVLIKAEMLQGMKSTRYTFDITPEKVVPPIEIEVVPPAGPPDGTRAV